MPIRIDLDDLHAIKKDLHAGDFCLLNGYMYTARDQAHIRLLEELRQDKKLPYDLEGACIFYAGPSPQMNDLVFGSVGPTTASRMDFAASELYRAGVLASIGKGQRSEEIVQACKETSSLYFVSVGGAAAELACHVKSSEIIAYKDLGPEAIRKIKVEDFPVFVAIDTYGEDLLKTVANRARNLKRGIFITYEGADGVGKSTQIKLLKEFLENAGKRVLVLREPGTTNIGEAIRDILLDREHTNMNDRTELLLYEAARAQLCDEVIIPALEAGTYVIVDRFYDSSLAYQGFGRGIDLEIIEKLNNFATQALKPDLTFLLHLPNSLERKLQSHEADRLELAGRDFMDRVAQGFLNIAQSNSERIKLIDASGNPKEVFMRIQEHLKNYL